MINRIPADIYWLIEANVRLPSEFSNPLFLTCLVLVKARLLKKKKSLAAWL